MVPAALLHSDLVIVSYMSQNADSPNYWSVGYRGVRNQSFDFQNITD